MSTVRIVDKHDPRISHEYSTDPTDYALGISAVLEGAEELLRHSRLRPDGYYVRDAVDDKDYSRHPAHFRAERFSINGALYRASDWNLPTEARRLDLHGPTLYHITVHHLRVAAQYAKYGREWPTYTLQAEPGQILHVASIFPLDDLDHEESEVIFEVFKKADEKIDMTYRELERIGEVAIPWPHRDDCWNLEDYEPAPRGRTPTGVKM